VPAHDRRQLRGEDEGVERPGRDGPDNSQPLDGDLAVDLQTLETGIGLRDDHLRKKYLEVERGPAYAQARLKNIRVDKLSGKTPFRAVLTLHGQTKEITGTADIKPEGDGYRLNASFPVRVSEFGIPEPTYLGVGVKDEVVVRVNLNAAPAAVATSGRSK
jgi:polyisoprenoid-binding protein YceI